MDIHTVGARVTATYCGGTVSGRLTDYRHHTINHQAVEYHIVPDGPFESAIGLLARDILFVYADWDGNPISFDNFNGSVKLA